MAKLTIMRKVGQERGRQWYHVFAHLDRAFDRAPKVKSRPAWRAPELTGVDPMEDPDFWIDEYTTKAEIDYRNRAHRAKFD